MTKKKSINDNLSSEERYVELVRSEFSNLLDKSPLFSFKPFDFTKQTLLRFINGRAIRKKTPNVHSEFDEYNRFCSVVSPHPPTSRAFSTNGRDTAYYKTIKFENDRFSLNSINVSLFDYNSRPITDITDNGYCYSDCIHKVKCMVNFNKRAVGAIFRCRLFLYLYSFPIMTNFGKPRRCYRFITFKDKEGKIEYDKLRTGILQTQYFAINQLINHPSLFAPTTKEMSNGWRDTTVQIFNEEFREKAENIRKRIALEMEKHNVKIDTIDDWVERV